MRKRVLLVDDMKTVILTEKMMLGAEGFELATASNGEEALEQVASNPPDIVLLDMIMPKLGGIETCRRLKGNESSRHIPVIMVTTRGEEESMSAAYEAGCDDYITKPFQKGDLLSKMKALLE